MEVDRHILTRYFTGESSEEEKESVREWLESADSNRKQFIRERIRFDASVIIDEDEVVTSRQPDTTKRILLNSLKVAAVVLLIICCSYFYGIYRIHHQNRLPQYLYVPPGSRTSLTLIDGSTVWLNSKTKLTYPGIFSDKRVVELDGEGFFEIAKNPAKPFIINAGKYYIEVLGTSFNIESYRNSADFEAALFTGRAKLFKKQENSDTLYLNAGETATLTGGKLVVSATDWNKYRWKDGIIMIENKSFEDIMRLFEKYFDLQIIVQTDEVKKLKYWGKFRIVDGIDHALRVLQNDYRFTYEREENSNTIYIH